jgi:hypothetical protein
MDHDLRRTRTEVGKTRFGRASRNKLASRRGSCHTFGMILRELLLTGLPGRLMSPRTRLRI